LQADRNAALIATRSAGKIRELRPLFAAHELAVIDLVEAGLPEAPEEEAIEEFPTFEANALAKARYFHGRSGRATFADDSGLVVRALAGEPGVRSRRWSGRADLSGQALDDENNRLLIERLRGVGDRRAHYVCAAAFVDDSREIVCRGVVHGSILEHGRGSSGFGYDPYFFSEELGRTFGESDPAEKERVSHRGRAFRALLDRLAMAGVV
jgi:Xanthosine triphosphate pyrophosphatase